VFAPAVQAAINATLGDLTNSPVRISVKPIKRKKTKKKEEDGEKKKKKKNKKKKKKKIKKKKKKKKMQQANNDENAAPAFMPHGIPGLGIGLRQVL
jgi:nitrate reductase cytochrome c-type subunit